MDTHHIIWVRGEKEIKAISENPAFNRGLIYSLHTYIEHMNKNGNYLIERCN